MKSPPPTDDPAGVWLRRISEQLDALPAAIGAAVVEALRQSGPPRRLAPDDETALRMLLPMIAAVMVNRTFSVRELLEYPALRSALESVGSAQKVGRLLTRGADADVGGLRIVESGRSREGMLRVVTTIHREPNTGVRQSGPVRLE